MRFISFFIKIKDKNTFSGTQDAPIALTFYFFEDVIDC